MEEYLAFVDYIGNNLDGKYVYRFDFTTDTDTVWGDYFNITPTIIVPDLQPENNTISKSAKVNFDKKLNIAKKNGCFSMQDCFDGIVSLAFTELTEDDTIYYKDEPLRFDFGEPYEQVMDKVNECGSNFYDVVNKQIGDESIIEKLIDKISSEEETNLTEDIDKSEEEFKELFKLKKGDKCNLEELKTSLFEHGYINTDYIKKEGEYSFRGYIVDIYSFCQAYPVRVSFFGDEIERIYKFEELSQNEIETVDEITIYYKYINE